MDSVFPRNRPKIRRHRRMNLSGRWSRMKSRLRIRTIATGLSGFKLRRPDERRPTRWSRQDGNVQLPLSVNGRPLTAQQTQQASLHLKKLAHNPDALRKSLRDEHG